MFKLWQENKIVNSDDYGNWPKDKNGNAIAPSEHFVAVKPNAKVKEVDDDPGLLSMVDVATSNAVAPETANNFKPEADDDDIIDEEEFQEELEDDAVENLEEASEQNVKKVVKKVAKKVVKKVTRK